MGANQEKALRLLNDQQLNKVTSLNENGEFVNYPKRNKLEYYGIKGKIAQDGVVLRESKYFIETFDDQYTPLFYREQVTFRNIMGINIVVTKDFIVNANVTCTDEEYKTIKTNYDLMNALYDDYEGFINGLKSGDKQVARGYKISPYVKKRK